MHSRKQILSGSLHTLLFSVHRTEDVQILLVEFCLRTSGSILIISANPATSTTSFAIKRSSARRQEFSRYT